MKLRYSSSVGLSICLGLALLACHGLAAQESANRVEVLCLKDRIVGQSLAFAGFDFDQRLMFIDRESAVETSERIVVERGEFCWWNGPAARHGQALLLLQDGSQLTGQVHSLQEATVELHSRYWQPVSIRRELTKAILFRIPENSQLRNQWLDRIENSLSQDRLWTRSGDYIDGRLKEMDDDGMLIFESAGEDIQLAASRIMAIVFAESLKRTDAAKYEVALRDGTRLRAEEIRFDQDAIHATLAGQSISLQARQPDSRSSVTNLVCGLKKLDSSVQFLSARTPLNYRHEPIVGHQVEVQTDRNLLGERIIHGNTEFSSGIGMSSKSSLVFRLDKPFTRMHFGVAMDESSGTRGSVVCRVLTLGGENQWQTAFESSMIRGGEPIVFDTVLLTGATAVALTVDYADGADVLDRVNWIMPTLVR